MATVQLVAQEGPPGRRDQGVAVVPVDGGAWVDTAVPVDDLGG